MLHSQMIQAPSNSGRAFSQQLFWEEQLRVVLKLLVDNVHPFTTLARAPVEFTNLFPLSVDQQALQAKRTHMLLSILLRLALAESAALQQFMAFCGVFDLFYDLAMGLTTHLHPNGRLCRSLKANMPEVHESLTNLYR